MDWNSDFLWNLPIEKDMRKPLFSLHICLFGAFLLLQSLGLFAEPPLDGQVILAGGRAGPQTARDNLLLAAESYWGTAYRYGGIDRGGMDCSGLVYASFKDSLAVSVPRSASALYNWTEKISAEALEPGDLVFFITQDRSISHVGIYTGEGRFIHSASDGPETGVIYSRLDEAYWQKSFAGAGRALPPVSVSGTSPAKPTPTTVASAPSPAPGNSPGNPGGDPEKTLAKGSPSTGSAENRGGAGSSRRESSNSTAAGRFRDKGFMVGVGFAPSWNSLADRNNPLRGVSFQGRFAWNGDVVGLNFIPGLEIRPEYDDVLRVFRMAFTLSLGFDERLRIFVGPAFSAGNPSIKMKSGNRPYTGGNAWLGAAGVTVAPFSIPLSTGKLDPFVELAWQSYHRGGGTDVNQNADISAGLRFSTGIRYTWDL